VYRARIASANCSRGTFLEREDGAAKDSGWRKYAPAKVRSDAPQSRCKYV
jgi:hypothetical protein